MKIRWWDWLPFRKWRLVGFVEDADEVPERLPRTGAVMVTSAGYEKWVVFDCPCGRGHRIMLNIDKVRRPHWRVGLGSDRTLTIAPSVDYKDAQKRCHYFVRNGRVRWTKDT